ncbi:3-phosphoshikimate 1-carboxyvinyltransferase [Bogoriella caseilytica]|uniref:3-phosphoshikimate 1-carboxyvinyltransferase n=1 Tax=Bogoriella caseilytica TaxID=56055 RepID=A0A3N2BES2_9MICO|nr:3-phosphoshikimate 1-carboxyvinyltransferase [Bogoriella caseilytica]ROR73761.1 3-phosphoshikimate 1-carboxyvinyltransferase [Bogoriella caseilytica]
MTQTASPWPAPSAQAPLDATVEVPGSKSLTNRHLLLAALADSPTELIQPLRSRDSALMISALQALGVTVTDTDAGLRLETAPLRGPAEIDAGLAGTVMRFVPALAVLADGEIRIDGDPRARERPMGPVIRALRDLGATIEASGPHGESLPLTIHASGSFNGGAVELDASASSQFVSALMLAAPAYRRGVDIRHVGGALPSLPHIAMTAQVLRERGVEVDEAEARWRVSPGTVSGGRIVVEPDLSNAGPFLAAALAAGGTVRVPRWPERTTQAGDLLRGILTRMGATVERQGDTLAVTGPADGVIRGLDVDLTEGGELAPTVAALCALAATPSRLRGIAHLRGHETDRLAALVTEITRLGGEARETPDGLEIEPATLRGAAVETYHDHRIATFAAIVGLRVPGVEVVNVATTAKTMPDFPGMWQGMLGQRA